MKKLTVGFQGERGAFSELAAINFFGDKAEPIPLTTFFEIFEQLKKKKLDCGIIPIENSLFGSVSENFDYLAKYPIKILAEVNQRIEHCLMGIDNCDIVKIKVIISHPQALGQCSRFLSKLKKVQKTPFYDTAGAAKHLLEKNDSSIAAIASKQAAKYYGLRILKKSIQNVEKNYTRFLIISSTKSSLKISANKSNKEKKVSIFFELNNEPGSLYKALSIFALRNINLTKIESRPNPDEVFHYNFFLDFIGSLNERKCFKAIDNLKEISRKVKILGEYFVGDVYDE